MNFGELFAINWNDTSDVQEILCSSSESTDTLVRNFSSIQRLVPLVHEETKQKIFNYCQCNFINDAEKNAI